MRKVKYQLYTKIRDGIFLYFNSFSSKYLLLDDIKHNLYQTLPVSELENVQPALYSLLLKNQFIVTDDFDEQVIVEYKKLSAKMDTTMYHIVINVTLDCNLKCWYCYETKIHNSNIHENILEAIKLNISLHYTKTRFKTLKLSFFGGEPFLNFKAIKEILEYAKSFCVTNDVVLLADFTTNAIAIKDEYINFLKDYTCFFQITLDGDKEKHNRVKHLRGLDTFQCTLSKIHKISQTINKSYIWVRINYDAQTLAKIDDIISEIEDLDRKRTFLILRKIWQTESDTITSSQLTTAIQHILNHNFFVDSYALSRSGVCFAERMNQVLINYDGKVFKCSTLTSFDEGNTLGKLDLESGEVSWNMSKISQIPRIMTNGRCSKCALFPCCLGPCNKNLLKQTERACILDEMNMSMQEFLMYNFKLNLLYENFDISNI